MCLKFVYSTVLIFLNCFFATFLKFLIIVSQLLSTIKLFHFTVMVSSVINIVKDDISELLPDNIDMLETDEKTDVQFIDTTPKCDLYFGSNKLIATDACAKWWKKFNIFVMNVESKWNLRQKLNI